MRPSTSLAISAVVGLAVAAALFSLTSQVRLLYTHSTPVCQAGESLQVDQPGFDPFSGEPHGRSFRCGDNGTLMSSSPEPDLSSRRAIAVPIGFLLGAAAASAVLFVVGRGARRGSSDIPVH